MNHIVPFHSATALAVVPAVTTSVAVFPAEGHRNTPFLLHVKAGAGSRLRIESVVAKGGSQDAAAGGEWIGIDATQDTWIPINARECRAGRHVLTFRLAGGVAERIGTVEFEVWRSWIVAHGLPHSAAATARYLFVGAMSGVAVIDRDLQYTTGRMA